MEGRVQSVFMHITNHFTIGMENGKPSVFWEDVCRIVFAADGTFCTSDKYSPSWSNSQKASTASGKAIPIYPPGPSLPNAIGLIPVDAPITIGGQTVSNPGPDMVLLTYWVGNMSRVNASWPQFPKGKDEFLTKFGVIPADEIK